MSLYQLYTYILMNCIMMHVVFILATSACNQSLLLWYLLLH